MAAEASTGQSDPKPEVEHEDDKHLRAKESTCRPRIGEREDNKRKSLDTSHVPVYHSALRTDQLLVFSGHKWGVRSKTDWLL